MRQIRNILSQPVKIAVAAVAVAIASLLTEGSLMNLWNMKVEKKKLQESYKNVHARNTELKSKILRAQSSDRFIGHEARERLDLVGEDELVFIFDN